MTQPASVSVIVCYDRPIVREGLHKLLDAEPDIDVVGTADNVTQAIILTRQTHPRVILTSLMLNQVSGVELIARIRHEELDPVPRFLVYATIEDDEMLATVLRSGVSGVLADDASPEEMLLAVRVAARGRALLGPGVAEWMLAWFNKRDTQTATTPPNLAFGSLTPREREVLLLTASGLSIEEIARRLFIGVTTVRTHIYRVRTKLQVKDRAQLVSLAYRAGLMPPT